MSDLYLDFREAGLRASPDAVVSAMQALLPGLRTSTFATEPFLLVCGRVDRPDLWGPFQSPEGDLLVALAGRVAMDDPEWEAATSVPGQGGLACKAVARRFRTEGQACLRQFSGNFTLVIHDRTRRKVWLASDRFGVCLLYEAQGPAGGRVLSTHPDLAARFGGVDSALDRASLGEFLASGRLTFPFTYYEHVRALEFGVVHCFENLGGTPARRTGEPFVTWQFRGNEKTTEAELAEALGAAFKKAVHRRSLPRLGKVGIGLSGGLDSRVILASATGGAPVAAFSLMDEENDEWRIARSLADACGVSIQPIRRDYDYYGRTARDGVRMSGGTGCLMSNHYLGIRGALEEMGVESLLTGCYCDYLFKGLALNTREHPLTRREEVAAFQFAFYRPDFPLAAPWQEALRQRRSARFPFAEGATLGEDEWWEVERRRVFPLAYEADLAQRVTPQRALPWYVPIAENDILDVYLRLPSRLKLNTRVFRNMVTRVCPPALCRIPDNNTGAAVTASAWALTVNRYRSALLNRARKKIKPGIATRGSWPNWEYYVQHSEVVTDLWSRPTDRTVGTLREVLGQDPFQAALGDYQGRRTEFFLRLLTVKLWMEGAPSAAAPAARPALASAIPA